MARGRSDAIPWGDLAGVRVGVVLWGGLAAIDVLRAAALPAYADQAAVALLVVVASVGAGTGTGLCAALTGWLLVDGFVEHRYGVLGFDVARDLGLVALFVALALVATRVPRPVGRRRRVPSEPRGQRVVR